MNQPRWPAPKKVHRAQLRRRRVGTATLRGGHGGLQARFAAMKVEIPMALAEKSGKTVENPKIPGLRPL